MAGILRVTILTHVRNAPNGITFSQLVRNKFKGRVAPEAINEELANLVRSGLITTDDNGTFSATTQGDRQ